MTRTTVTAEQEFSWSIHDTWTELYVGIHHLVYGVLPAASGRAEIEHGAMSQLALVGSNQLVEIALYRLLAPFAHEEGSINKLQNETYFDMLTKWVPRVSGRDLDFLSDPFFSTELLRKGRNNTIHKKASPVSIPMARAALSTAVIGTIALHRHFDRVFPYAGFLERWELGPEALLSSLDTPTD